MSIERSNVQVATAARELTRRTGRGVFVTIGAEGIVYVDEEETHSIPGIPVSGPIDIVGAGDSTMAGIASALCAGATPAQAARVGCVAASITIQQIGVTGTATPDQIRARFQASSSQRPCDSGAL